jgi:hypothetical protein
LWGKKDKRCSPDNPADSDKGSQWDHIGLEARNKVRISLVVGPRTKDNTKALVKDFAERTDKKPPKLITSDEHKPYRDAILQAYGKKIEYPRTGRPGRPRNPRYEPPPELVYATVHKHRRKGRVVKIEIRPVFGSLEKVQEAVEDSPVSCKVNTTFVERFNGTVRQHNSRKQRKVYSFSKKFAEHEALSWLTVTHYNFCRPHGGLRIREAGGWRKRSPALAAGLTDRIWSLRELFTYVVVDLDAKPEH